MINPALDARKTYEQSNNMMLSAYTIVGRGVKIRPYKMAGCLHSAF